MRSVSLYVRTVLLASLSIAVSGCHSNHAAVAAKPANPPALKSQAPPAPVVAQQTTQSQVSAKQDEAPVQKPAADETAKASPAATDAIGDLIARVEKEYQAGVNAYHAGKTDDAKESFDNSLNDLLGSNFDVRSDERLEKEFNRIVAGVNSLYPGGTQAEADPSQEAQQKAEPAPIDETNGIAPSADAGTKAKAEAEIQHTRSDLPLMMTDQVAGYITYFSSNRGRGIFERAYSRSGRYHDMIVSTLEAGRRPAGSRSLSRASRVRIPSSRGFTRGSSRGSGNSWPAAKDAVTVCRTTCGSTIVKILRNWTAPPPAI